MGGKSSKGKKGGAATLQSNIISGKEQLLKNYDIN